MKIKTINAALATEFNLGIGNWEKLFMVSEDLEVPTGVDLTNMLLITIRGITKISVPLLQLIKFTNILEGMPTYDVTTGATDTISYAAYLYFGLPAIQLKSALDIADDKDLTLTYRPGNIISGLLNFHKIEGEFLPEAYEPRIDKLEGSDAGTKNFNIENKNPLYILIIPRDPTDVITILKDGKLLENCPASELIRRTEIDNRIEAESIDYIMFNLCRSGNMVDAAASQVQVIIDHGGAGTTTLYVYSVDVESNKIRTSMNKQIIKRNSKISAIGLSRPEVAQVIREKEIQMLPGQSIPLRPPRRLRTSV